MEGKWRANGGYQRTREVSVDPVGLDLLRHYSAVGLGLTVHYSAVGLDLLRLVDDPDPMELPLRYTTHLLIVS